MTSQIKGCGTPVCSSSGRGGCSRESRANRALSEPGLTLLCRGYCPTGGLRALLSQGRECWLGDRHLALWAPLRTDLAFSRLSPEPAPEREGARWPLPGERSGLRVALSRRATSGAHVRLAGSTSSCQQLGRSGLGYLFRPPVAPRAVSPAAGLGTPGTGHSSRPGLCRVALRADAGQGRHAATCGLSLHCPGP